MSNATTINVLAEAGEEAAEIQAMIRQMFARMNEIDARIAQDQVESDRLQTETRAMLAELKTFNNDAFSIRTK